MDSAEVKTAVSTLSDQELSQLAEEFIRADAEYWRELELLSGQRAHFKPGLTDETRYADDEVAA